MKRMELLDCGRFFAAFYVMLFHYTFNGIVNGKITSVQHISGFTDISKYGYLGVEFFFMISGYVIFFSAQDKTASQFITSRFLRLYPAFWTAVLFTSFFAFFWGGVMMAVSPIQTVANLTMWPALFDQKFVDAVYWTLNYEMSFYFAVFIVLLAAGHGMLTRVILLWPLLLLCALILNVEQLPYMGGHYNFFAAGAVLAVLKQKSEVRGWIALAVSFFLCMFYGIGHAELLELKRGALYSPVMISLIICSFFAFFLLNNTEAGSAISIPGSKILGALTYPLYLVHAHFGYMIINQFAHEGNKILVYSLLIVLVLVISYGIHRIVELNLSHFWKELFDRYVGAPALRCERGVEKWRANAAADWGRKR